MWGGKATVDKGKQGLGISHHTVFLILPIRACLSESDCSPHTQGCWEMFRFECPWAMFALQLRVQHWQVAITLEADNVGLCIGNSWDCLEALSVHAPLQNQKMFKKWYLWNFLRYTITLKNMYVPIFLLQMNYGEPWKVKIEGGQREQ